MILILSLHAFRTELLGRKNKSALIKASELEKNDLVIIIDQFPHQIENVEPCHDQFLPNHTILVKALDLGLKFPHFECFTPDTQLTNIQYDNSLVEDLIDNKDFLESDI